MAGERRLGEATQRDAYALLPHRALVAGLDAERVELGGGGTLAGAELDATAREHVEGRDPFGDPRRMVDRGNGVHDPVSEPDAVRALRRRREEELGRARVRVLLEEVVLDEPRAVEAQAVGELDLLERLAEDPLLVAVGPRARHLVLEEQPELHRAPRPRRMYNASSADCRTDAVARGIRLSVDEAWDALERAHTGVLTTLRRDGVPISLPVWFVALDRRIYVSGPAHTKKFARVRARSTGELSRRVGRALGRPASASISPEPRRIVDDAAAPRARGGSARRQVRPVPHAPRRDARRDTRANYETAVTTIEITPDDRILSWENARLFAPDPS